MRIKGDQNTSRQINRRMILNLLRSEGAISRAKISSIVGLSPAAVTFVVAELMAENILIEIKSEPKVKRKGVGATGRRPIPVDINYAGRLAVGIKLMADSIECVLTDLATKVLASVCLPLDKKTPEEVLAACLKGIDKLLAQQSASKATLIGIGVAVPGTIDTTTGVCVESHRLKWKNVPLASLIAEHIHVPVWLDDDTNAFALAQNLFGLARQNRTASVLAIGAGISCSNIINGNVHRGANGIAGKLGHIQIDPNGSICECGKRGCLQTFCSEPAIVQQWRELKCRSGDVTRFDLVKAAEDGDSQTIKLLDTIGRKMGEYLAINCNIIDPEVIIVGGEAVAFGDYLFDPMREALEKFCFWQSPKILPDWADDSWAQGAAALATQKIFNFEAVSGLLKSK